MPDGLVVETARCAVNSVYTWLTRLLFVIEIVISVAPSPTGGLFATGSGDMRARIWRLVSQKAPRLLYPTHPTGHYHPHVFFDIWSCW